jgi:hypothetical protein
MGSLCDRLLPVTFRGAVLPQLDREEKAKNGNVQDDPGPPRQATRI